MTQKPPETLNREETNKLLDWIKNGRGDLWNSRVRQRNYTMTLLMSDAGLRVGEVVRLKIKDLLLNGEPVKAVFIPVEITKGDMDRLVPLSERLREAIQKMLETWWESYPESPDDFCFYTQYKNTHLSVRQVQRIIEQTSVECLGRAIHPHVLRHTFASRMMRVTNSRVVQQLLGHKNITTTQIYEHPNGDDLTKAISALEN